MYIPSISIAMIALFYMSIYPLLSQSDLSRVYQRIGDYSLRGNGNMGVLHALLGDMGKAWYSKESTYPTDSRIGSTTSSSNVPGALSVGAVFVPFPQFSTENNELRGLLKEHLLQGLRFALLTGAPWLVLVGSHEDCRVAQHHLHHLETPAASLLPAEFIESVPVSSRIVVQHMKDSMTSSTDLKSWLLKGRLVPDLPPWPTPGTVYSEMVTVDRHSASEKLHIRMPHSTAMLAQSLLDQSTEVKSDVEVLVSSAPSTSAGVADGSETLTHPRLLVDTDYTYILPGIVFVEEGDDSLRPSAAARAFQHWKEETVLRRRQRMQLEIPLKRDLWWLNASHSVLLITSLSDQQHDKLLYGKAMRDAAGGSVTSIERLVRQYERSRNVAERAPKYPSASASLPAFNKQLQVHVFVLPPSKTSFQSNHLGPAILPFKETADNIRVTMNPDAPLLARQLAVYSHYLYLNYRRWMDRMLAYSFVGRHGVGFNLLLRILQDMGAGRIAWRDVFF